MYISLHHNLDFRGVDSVRIQCLGGGIPRSVGHIPRKPDSGILCGFFLGRLAVPCRAPTRAKIIKHHNRNSNT